MTSQDVIRIDFGLDSHQLLVIILTPESIRCIGLKNIRFVLIGSRPCRDIAENVSGARGCLECRVDRGGIGLVGEALPEGDVPGRRTPRGRDG